jgi:hypothetical protein
VPTIIAALFSLNIHAISSAAIVWNPRNGDIEINTPMANERAIWLDESFRLKIL